MPFKSQYMKESKHIFQDEGLKAFLAKMEY